MVTIAMWFLFVCGVFLIGSAIALHAGCRVPQFMEGRTAFGQLCQGAAAMFLSQACATTDPNLVTWVAVAAAPCLVFIGVRADHGARISRPRRVAQPS